ncbi:hypothetical protein T4E_4237 [Trichinella pseudospiralis]|uniref:Uncharacterized protein n=1 Tax=Trichinella pseudospiralis TaxID=6337 RepID=A0A0V0Y766_TRIPS|nr:hypothetical protein T4E_4237 [Trichinella pseudospiralis]
MCEFQSKSQTDQGTVVQLDSISQSSNGFMTASDYGSRVNSLVAAEPCPVHYTHLDVAASNIQDEIRLPNT